MTEHRLSMAVQTLVSSWITRNSTRYRLIVCIKETLLSSGDSRDWIKISEMFLGPAPESWVFIPKHKSNAYEAQG